MNVTAGELAQAWLLGFSGLSIWGLALSIEDASDALWRWWLYANTAWHGTFAVWALTLAVAGFMGAP